MQWTPAKFKAVLDLRLDPHDDGHWRQEVLQARAWKPGRGLQPTLVQVYRKLAWSWNLSTAERNKQRQKQQKQLLPDPDVTEEQFVDLYEEQKGLYAYLGFPLRLDVQSIGGEATDWAISPERVNDDGGYTISNLVLVVREVALRSILLWQECAKTSF